MHLAGSSAAVRSPRYRIDPWRLVDCQKMDAVPLNHSAGDEGRCAEEGV